MHLPEKMLLYPLERTYKPGHPDDPQYNGVLPKLNWIVFYRRFDGETAANFFVEEHSARDFCQEQNIRDYLREVHGC